MPVPGPKADVVLPVAPRRVGLSVCRLKGSTKCADLHDMDAMSQQHTVVTCSDLQTCDLFLADLYDASALSQHTQ
eukprot:1159899-Pelagomonas_calceolata.AAC.7